MSVDKIEDLVQEFHHEAKKRSGFEIRGIAKGHDLRLEEVSYAFEIREVDGCEGLERANPDFGRRRNIRIEESRL